MGDRNCNECNEDHPPSPQGYDMEQGRGWEASDTMEEAAAGWGEWERHEEAEASRADLRTKIAALESERSGWLLSESQMAERLAGAVAEVEALEGLIDDLRCDVAFWKERAQRRGPPVPRMTSEEIVRLPECLAEAQPVEDASVPVLILDDGSRIPLTGEIAELARKDAGVPVLILADGRRLPLTEGVAEAAREACEEDGDE